MVQVGFVFFHVHLVFLPSVVVPVRRRAGSGPRGKTELDSLLWINVLGQAQVKGEHLDIRAAVSLLLQEHARDVLMAPPGIKRHPDVHGLLKTNMADAHFAAQGVLGNTAAEQLHTHLPQAGEEDVKVQHRLGETQSQLVPRRFG